MAINWSEVHSSNMEYRLGKDRSRSTRLDVGRPDHLARFLGFGGDEAPVCSSIIQGGGKQHGDPATFETDHEYMIS